MNDSRARRGGIPRRFRADGSHRLGGRARHRRPRRASPALDAVTGTAGANKARTVAATLAEKDQEQLRSLMTVDLTGSAPLIPGPRDVEVDGVPYTVKSDAEWVTDAGGENISCALDDGEGSFMRITSTVTSPMTGAEVKPVVITQHRGAASRAPARSSRSSRTPRGQPVKNLGVAGDRAATTTRRPPTRRAAPSSAPSTPGAYTSRLNQTAGSTPTATSRSPRPPPSPAGTLTTVEILYDQSRATVTVNVAVAATAARRPVRATTRTGVIGRAHRASTPSFRTVAGRRPRHAATSFKLELFPFETPYKIFSGRCTGPGPDQVPGRLLRRLHGGGADADPRRQRRGDHGPRAGHVNINATLEPDRRSGVDVYAYPTRRGLRRRRILLGTDAVDGRPVANPGLPFGDLRHLRPVHAQSSEQHLVRRTISRAWRTPTSTATTRPRDASTARAPTRPRRPGDAAS